GGLLGFELGDAASQALPGAMAGALIAVLLVAGVDALRGYRVMRWLSAAPGSDAPRMLGFWGEMGTRIERALRVRERATSIERDRLAQFLPGVESSPNGVLLLDASEQIEWCSHLAAEHLGLDRMRDLRQRVTNL